MILIRRSSIVFQAGTVWILFGGLSISQKAFADDLADRLAYWEANALR